MFDEILFTILEQNFPQKRVRRPPPAGADRRTRGRRCFSRARISRSAARVRNGRKNARLSRTSSKAVPCKATLLLNGCAPTAVRARLGATPRGPPGGLPVSSHLLRRPGQ